MDIVANRNALNEDNVVYARFQFQSRCQASSETFYQYLQDVRDLAKNCRFDNQEESLIRDRIIFGLKDIRLRDDIIRDGGDPSLEYIVQKCRRFAVDGKDGEPLCDDRTENAFQIFMTETIKVEAIDVTSGGEDNYDQISTFSENSAICDNDDDQKSTGGDSVRSNYTIKTHQCRQCDKKFSRKFNLQRHVSVVHGKPERLASANTEKEKNAKIPCPKCDKVFKRLLNMKRHLQHFHLKSDELVCENAANERETDSWWSEDTNLESRVAEFVCTLCDKQYSRKTNLRRHIWAIHASPTDLRCNNCQQVFVNVDKLKSHMLTYINGSLDSPYKCHICDTTFKQKFYLNCHLLSSHRSTDNSELICPICLVKFSTANSLNFHMAQHSGQSFTCDICKNEFHLKYHLRRHMHRHIKDSTKHSDDAMKLECYVCKRTYVGEQNLLNHMQQHHRDKPLLCSICGKRFSYVSQLNIHVRTHTGEKPYSCIVCQRPFRRKDDMESHMIVHTGQRPFDCELCGKRFGRRHKLKLHMMAHRGDKPFKCTVCSKSFISQSHLKGHFISHTGEYPYKCNECPKQYRKTSYLKKHMKKSHFNKSEIN